MHVTRKTELKAYPAKKHHGMIAFRLQGGDASPTESLSVGLSLFLPAGGAEKSSSPTEKVYVVFEGEITIILENEVVTLGPLDSCTIEANEERVIENRTKEVAKMLVVSV